MKHRALAGPPRRVQRTDAIRWAVVPLLAFSTACGARAAPSRDEGATPRPVPATETTRIVAPTVVAGSPTSVSPTSAPPTSTQPAPPVSTQIPLAAVASTATVSMRGNKFVQAQITIPAGTTVTWRNEDQEDHDVLSLDLSFASPIVKPGTTYPQLFSEPGTFPYL